MQTQADVLGLAVSRPADVETTAMGAALAAGVGAGLWTEGEVLGASGVSGGNRDEDSGAVEFTPAVTAEEREERYARWCDAVDRSLGLVDVPS